MDLARTGFETPITGTASYKFDTDANGNLVTTTSGIVAAGSKRISFNNIAANANMTNISSVISAFTQIIPGSGSITPDYQSETTITVKWEAA